MPVASSGEPDRSGGEVFATIDCAVRIWAVAAIHGEFDHLRRLHDQLETRFVLGDRLVYLGNYLGHGAAIVATADELLEFRRHLLCRPGMEPDDIAYLRGGQEEMWRKLLQLQFAPNPGEVLDWMLAHGVEATLCGYGGDVADGRSRIREGALALTRWTSGLRRAMQSHPGHDELMAALRRYAVTPDGGLVFVHAGIDPTRPLSEQRDTLWWGTGDVTALTESFGRARLVVRGFDRARRGFGIGQHGASLDAGCGFGGPLVAACWLPSGQLADRIEG